MRIFCCTMLHDVRYLTQTKYHIDIPKCPSSPILVHARLHPNPLISTPTYASPHKLTRTIIPSHAQPHAPEILHHLFTHAWVKPLFNSNWGAAPEPSVHNGKSPSPNLVLDIKLLPRDLACGPESIWGRLI